MCCNACMVLNEIFEGEEGIRTPMLWALTYRSRRFERQVLPPENTLYP